MEEYLTYLKDRAKSQKLDFNERKFAQAEYNRALDFARRKGLTTK